MKKTLLAAVATAGLLVSASGAMAQDPGTSTTTTTTWTNEYGNMIRQESVTKHYKSVDDPTIQVRVGAEVPSSVVTYELPATVTIPERDRYGYFIVKDRPVIIDKRTHRVVYPY